MRQKVFSMLALLLMAVSGAWAQTYTATEPAAAIFAIDTDGTTQDFGSVEADATAQKIFTITNSGNKPLFVTISNPADFTAEMAPNAADKNVYFTDALGWGDIHIYYWPNGPEWPGAAMTELYTNELGQKVYCYELPADVEGIIFNGNGNWTGDITDEPIGKAYYTKDDNTVGTWSYDNCVPAGMSRVLTVTMNTATLGSKSGNITLSFDAKNATSFTIPCTGEVAAPTTYIVAGNYAEIFEIPWYGTYEANKMTKGDDGKYTKTYNVEDAFSDIELKVVKDGEDWIGDKTGNNVTFSMKQAGSFTVTLDPNANPVYVTVTGDNVVLANTEYAINYATGMQNGTVTGPDTAKEDDEVTLTITPAAGYVLESISVTGVTTENAVEVTDGKFTMPAEDVNVIATFKLVTYSITVKEGTEDAANWTVSPNPAEAGQTVTITYAGTKSVKSVTAKRKITTGNIMVYFTDSKNWGDVHVYYWSNGPEWPGTAMTEVETNEYNQKIYRAEIPATAEGIIFNGNGSQTGDITENIADGSWWYSTNNSEVAYNNKYTIEVTNVDDNKWTFTMTASDVELQVEYYATTPFDLTLATGSDAHGTVAFTVDGAAATQAKKDDVVTVSVTPNEGYSAKGVTVRAYTSWEDASDILTGGGNNPELVSDITVTKQENGTWQFTMPEANVWVVVTYTKNLQDAWIQNIDNQTYTGSAIEPTVTVKDGETALVLNTDYTVAYTNNTEVGEATVTVTGTGNYSGTVTATFTILADKSALNSAITAAEAYYNSIKDDHYDAATTFLEAINDAKTMQEKGNATQEEVGYAVAALNTAKTTAEAAVLTDTKNKLAEDISAAENYYNSISTLFPEVAANLQTAINAAKGVKDNTEATQEQIEAAIAALASAKTTAEQAGSEGLYVVMGAIGEAGTYYNSIKDSYPTIAGDMEKEVMTIWDAVITGSYNSTAENAIAEINAAVNAAKAKIASIVAITIPAKSYVARIDADKRQIETAVAGVGLYSVKSVTNTEVELTAELSVIAAEMPYFIYNDNDTEVEVSIVVSSSDADNVAYDSDHFKGTLVDKTFTYEDMEEADHYVLSGGSFVWVKDAGTLAAGKCWIQLEKSPANARALSIVHEGETTGISTVKTAADTKDAAVYDLQGRRVNKPVKGLFIVNGRKVVIK